MRPCYTARHHSDSGQPQTCTVSEWRTVDRLITNRTNCRDSNRQTVFVIVALGHWILLSTYLHTHTYIYRCACVHRMHTHTNATQPPHGCFLHIQMQHIQMQHTQILHKYIYILHRVSTHIHPVHTYTVATHR